VLGAVDPDFGFIDGHLLSSLAVGLEQVLAPVEPVPDRLLTTAHDRLDLPE